MDSDMRDDVIFREDQVYCRLLLRAIAVLFVIAAPALGAESDDEKVEEDSHLDLPLARIDGKPLTVYYFERAATGLKDFEREKLATEKGRMEFLFELIDVELQAQEAVRRAYDRHEEVQEAFKENLARAMEMYLRINTEAQDPTEDDLRRYYDDHPDRFNTSEKVRAKHILVKDKNTAQRLLMSVLKTRPSPSVFGRLAKGGGDGALKSLDLGFITRPGEPREGDPPKTQAIAEAAFKLKQDGEIYPELIESEHGYHILMRTGYAPRKHISYEEAKDRGLEDAVRMEILKKKVDEKVEALKEKFPVVVYDDNLKEIVF
jgi:peptidyl-prolyl cis-trans isomerase C